MQNTLDEGAMARLEDHSHIDTPEVTREEVCREGSQEATNGKAAGDDRVVTDLLKSGGETMMD